MLPIQRFSFGIGDRFAHQGKAQLTALIHAHHAGVPVTPVWNKSNREHQIVGSTPGSVLEEAREAVAATGYRGEFRIDADHINLSNVEPFLGTHNFFTIDVADSIGRPAPRSAIDPFLRGIADLEGRLALDGLAEPLTLTREDLAGAAAKYLAAATEAGEIYRHIAGRRGDADFVTEISMDETDAPQTPADLLVILAAVAREGIPLQTIAPKFSGRFNKGVDYVGDLAQFEREFNADLAVIAHAVERFGLPSGLKLSVHSGSDKFSLYPIIRRAIARTGAGLHVKTAGTTWLEELIGLTEAGGEGLALVQLLYSEALARREELCAPYATVIDIDPERLPDPLEVSDWNSPTLAGALRHEPANPLFNPHLRQLMHVSYKLAAERLDTYTGLLEECAEPIAANVIENIYERHLRPLFIDPIA
jgi:hypothetical protein